MRMAEVRERYAARRPRRAAALLLWRAGDGGGAVQDRLYPSLPVAMRAAAEVLADPHGHEVYLYDGQRLYDRKAIAGWVRRDRLAWQATLAPDAAPPPEPPAPPLRLP